MSVTNKIWVFFGVQGLIIAFVAGISWWSVIGLKTNVTDMIHCKDVVVSLQDVLSLMKDAETGQRGYLLTGNPRYLEPYTNAKSASSRTFAELDALLNSESGEQNNLGQLHKLSDAKFDELGETIELRTNKGFDAALEVVKTDRGKKFMDDIRGIIGPMSQNKSNIMAQSVKAADQSASMATTIIFWGGLVLVIGTIYTAYNLIIRPLKAQQAERERTITAVRDTLGRLGVATANILAGVTQGAAGSQEQAAAISEVVTTVDEVVQTSDQAAQRAMMVAQSAQHCDQVGREGARAVDQAVEVMNDVKTQSSHIADTIVGLVDKAQSITDIVSMVDDISNQTHLLALNASIEATRAGESGKAFSVVAGEVKSLADESKKATARIRKLLGEVEKAMNTAVLASEQGSKTVNEGYVVVGKAGETIKTLERVVTDASELSSQIAASAKQLAVGTSQIQSSMNNISQVTQQNLQSIRQSELTAQNLKELGIQLQDFVKTISI